MDDSLLQSAFPSSLLSGFVPAIMDLMIDFADKPDLMLQLIRSLGLLSTECSIEDYRKVGAICARPLECVSFAAHPLQSIQLSPLAAAMLIRNMQTYVFEPLDSPFVNNQMMATLQAIHQILSRRPLGTLSQECPGQPTLISWKQVASTRSRKRS